MKKTNIQKKKLTKNELKKINGGQVGPCWEGFCRTGEFEEWRPGAGDRNGYCC
jgi:bacteriocin-like protein